MQTVRHPDNFWKVNQKLESVIGQNMNNLKGVTEFDWTMGRVVNELDTTDIQGNQNMCCMLKNIGELVKE